jgi:hypothetical protein
MRRYLSFLIVRAVGLYLVGDVNMVVLVVKDAR